eukprot:3241657-Pyramimonas_sp.AAC.1
MLSWLAEEDPRVRRPRQLADSMRHTRPIPRLKKRPSGAEVIPHNRIPIVSIEHGRVLITDGRPKSKQDAPSSGPHKCENNQLAHSDRTGWAA